MFLYLPLVILAIYAFNPSRIMAWPPTGFTLQWFVEAANEPGRHPGDHQLADRRHRSRRCIALVLGTLASLAVQRYSFFGQETVSFLLVLPIALPGVVTGLALRTSFVTFGIDFGLLTIIVGHATFCVVIAYNNVIARLRRLPRHPRGGLGRPRRRRVHDVPARHAARACARPCCPGALLAFALSFDEIIVTNFTAGAGTQTLPMWILAAIQRPTELPVVNVVALVLILISVIPVYLATRISSGVAGART